MNQKSLISKVLKEDCELQQVIKLQELIKNEYPGDLNFILFCSEKIRLYCIERGMDYIDAPVYIDKV